MRSKITEVQQEIKMTRKTIQTNFRPVRKTKANWKHRHIEKEHLKSVIRSPRETETNWRRRRKQTRKTVLIQILTVRDDSRSTIKCRNDTI